MTKKLILLIINIIGGMAMVIGMLIPFMAMEEGVQLFAFMYFMCAGFVLWYVSAKAMEGGNQ